MSKILIADDDDHYRTLIEKILKEAGHQIISASDGDLAWKKIQEESPDMAVLDVNMPGKNGFELCKLIRSTPKFKNMPVLILTVLSETDKQVKGYDLGADDYVPKPFNSQVLVARVRKLEQRILGKRSSQGS